MNYLRLGIFIVLLLFLSRPTWASEVEDGIQLPAGIMYRVALQYVFENAEAVHLSNEAAGLLKFRWKQNDFVDDEALVEVIGTAADRSKVRVTLPKDFAGRADLFLHKLLKMANEVTSGKWGEPLQAKPEDCYRAALRYVLKSFVSSTDTEPEVIRKAREDAGIIQFSFREAGFVDPHAGVRILPLGEHQSQIKVVLPMDPGRRRLLEKKMVAAIKKDLENEKENRF